MEQVLPIIAQKCNQWDKIYTDRCQFSDISFISKYTEEQYLQKGDIIINSTGGGTVGRTGIVEDYIFEKHQKFVADSHVTVVRGSILLNPYYLYYYLISPYIQTGIEERCSGSTNQIELGTSTIYNYLIPVPPYKEQLRIIELMGVLLQKVEKYRREQEKLENLRKILPLHLKKSILQEAIQGKLVPQDPNDEPASVLLQRIKEERLRLVAEGKLKKKDVIDSTIFRGDDNRYYEKKGKEIICIDEEIPFEIPESWEWYRMGTIGIWGAGSTPAKGNPNYYGGNILWLRTGELNNSVVYDTEIKITQKALEDCSLRMNKIGDVMIAMYGATIGKVAIAGAEMTTNQACCACTPIGIFNWYLFYFLMASQQDFIKKGEGGAQPNISREKLISHMIPIPPLAEQRRIVETLKILLNKIKGN